MTLSNIDHLLTGYRIALLFRDERDRRSMLTSYELERFFLYVLVEDIKDI